MATDPIGSQNWWLHNALVFTTATSLAVTMMLTLKNVFKKTALDQISKKAERPRIALVAYCTVWVSSKAGLGLLTVGAKLGPSYILWSHTSENGQHFADARTTQMVLVIAIILGMAAMVSNELARVCEDPKDKFSAAESGSGVQAIAVVIAGIAGGAVLLSVRTYMSHAGKPGICTMCAQLCSLGVFASCLALMWAFTRRSEAPEALQSFDEYRAATGWFPGVKRHPYLYIAICSVFICGFLVL